jgi:hypothetical protein
MSRRIHPGWILGTVLCCGLPAETIASDQAGPDSGCGQKITMRDVLVLDLEPLRAHPEMAQEFVVERAGEFRLLTTKLEEIRTRSRPSRDPDSMIRRARKLGAEHGCDLVLVLKTGPYFGRQRSMRARIKEHGYAFVVMGRRTAD